MKSVRFMRLTAGRQASRRTPKSDFPNLGVPATERPHTVPGASRAPRAAVVVANQLQASVAEAQAEPDIDNIASHGMAFDWKLFPTLKPVAGRASL